MLETWDAIRLERVNRSGRTKPLIVECSKINPATATSERREFLVKAIGLPEIREQSLFCEITGNWLARELGVNTPTPVLVRLSDDFTGVINQVLRGEGITLKTGIGAGCEYIKGGFTGFSSTSTITTEEISQAILIYGFDILLQNPDRRPDKPNLGFLGDRLIAFDFELAFSFLQPVIGLTCAPWEVAQNGLGPRHLFAKQLSSQELDWKPLLHALEQVKIAQLDLLAELLPASWSGYMPQMKTHLINLQENLPKLEFELQRSLKG